MQKAWHILTSALGESLVHDRDVRYFDPGSLGGIVGDFWRNRRCAVELTQLIVHLHLFNKKQKEQSHLDTQVKGCESILKF